MAFKKSTLPDGALIGGTKVAGSTPFTAALTEECMQHPGDWYKVDNGSPVGAATWARNLNKEVKGNKEPYEWAKVDTGETKAAKSGDRNLTVWDIYVRYNPED